MAQTHWCGTRGVHSSEVLLKPRLDQDWEHVMRSRWQWHWLHFPVPLVFAFLIYPILSLLPIESHLQAALLRLSLRHICEHLSSIFLAPSLFSLYVHNDHTAADDLGVDMRLDVHLDVGLDMHAVGCAAR